MSDLLTMLETAQRGMQVLRALRETDDQPIRDRLRQTDPRRAHRTSGGPHFTAQGHDAVTRRFGPGRIHKAGSAEAIVTSVLRGRGWTREFRDGELTGNQHLGLLEDVRQYGRQWLRHEAEAFFHRYGVENEEAEKTNEFADATENRSFDGKHGGGCAGPAGNGNPKDGITVCGNDGIPEIVRSVASRAAAALGRLFDRARNFVHELIFAGAMALKGDYELSAEELATLNNQATIQREYLDKFEREVAANPPREILDLGSSVITISPAPMTPGQFVARIEQYANSAHQGAQKSNRSTAKVGNMFTEERRYLGVPTTQHCSDCPPIANLKWQPIGTLPEIGDTECGGFCLCWFEYRNGPNGRSHVGPLKPAGPKVKRIPNAPQAKQAEPPKTEPVKTEVPAKEVPKPKPAKSDNYPPARPLPSVQELLDAAGSPFKPEDYEEA